MFAICLLSILEGDRMLYRYFLVNNHSFSDCMNLWKHQIKLTTFFKIALLQLWWQSCTVAPYGDMITIWELGNWQFTITMITASCSHEFHLCPLLLTSDEQSQWEASRGHKWWSHNIVLNNLHMPHLTITIETTATTTTVDITNGYHKSVQVLILRFMAT